MAGEVRFLIRGIVIFHSDLEMSSLSPFHVEIQSPFLVRSRMEMQALIRSEIVYRAFFALPAYCFIMPNLGI